MGFCPESIGYCPYCKKDTRMCKNWIHSEDDKWYHECWECDSVFKTNEKLSTIDSTDTENG